MKVRNLVATVAGAWLLCMPAQAEAATYLVSFDGVVTDGTDEAHLFRGPSTSLDGAAFTASYRFDYPSPSVSVENLPFGTVLHIGLIARASASAVTLTIFDTPVAMGSTDVEYIRALSILGEARSISVASDHSVVGRGRTEDYRITTSMNSVNTSFFESLLPFSPLDYTILSNAKPPYDVVGSGSFSIRIATTIGGARITGGNLKVRHVRVSELAAPVPEPKVWAMLIFGFAAAGSAARARTGRRLLLRATPSLGPQR